MGDVSGAVIRLRIADFGMRNRGLRVGEACGGQSRCGFRNENSNA